MTLDRTRRVFRGIKWLVSGTPAQRRRSRQELARISAGMFGDFPLSDDYKIWRGDTKFLSDFQRLSPNNPYSQDRKWVLREYVRVGNGLLGDLAECGCFEGASAYFMLQASTHGMLYLFDSFQGISEPDGRDSDIGADVMPWAKGDLRSSEQKLRANLTGSEAYCALAGWIPERFAEVADKKFRVVHIDVDLHQPTYDSLEFFYPRLVDGGVIVMDDYGFLTCPGARRAADEYARSQGIEILHLATGQGVITKRPA
jgi:O-methyltransferase